MSQRCKQVNGTAEMAGVAVLSTQLLLGEPREDERCDPYMFLNQGLRSGSREREGRNIKDLLLSLFCQNMILSGPTATVCLSRDVLQPPYIFFPLALLLCGGANCSWIITIRSKNSSLPATLPLGLSRLFLVVSMSQWVAAQIGKMEWK